MTNFILFTIELLNPMNKRVGAFGNNFGELSLVEVS